MRRWAFERTGACDDAAGCGRRDVGMRGSMPARRRKRRALEGRRSRSSIMMRRGPRRARRGRYASEDESPMCGIAGVIGPESLEAPDPLAPALASLASRGPDGGGRAVGRLGGRTVALGARRLSLVDVAGGRQPFSRPSGALLVMNGEIYNHDALRKELAAKGEAFRTRSDGEVLAALLETEGVAGLSRA